VTGQRTIRVKVRDGFGVYHDGDSHGGGAVLDVPADLAENWLAGGFVEKAAERPAAKSSSKAPSKAASSSKAKGTAPARKAAAKPASSNTDKRQAAGQPRRP
jgi:hypothetical protein